MEEKVIKLSALNDLFLNKSKYKTQTEKGHIGISDNAYNGSQGEYNETFNYYKHPELPEGIFMRETLQSNSYGDNDSIVKIEFVEGIEKTVKVFEPIK